MNFQLALLPLHIEAHVAQIASGPVVEISLHLSLLNALLMQLKLHVLNLLLEKDVLLFDVFEVLDQIVVEFDGSFLFNELRLLSSDLRSGRTTISQVIECAGVISTHQLVAGERLFHSRNLSGKEYRHPII